LSLAGIRENDLLDAYEAAIEGEYYHNKFTLSISARISNIEYENPAPFIDTDETGFSSAIGIPAYPLDNLAVTTSYSHRLDNNLYELLVEC